MLAKKILIIPPKSATSIGSSGGIPIGRSIVSNDTNGNYVVNLSSADNQVIVLTGITLVVPNGNFETGDLTSWTDGSTGAIASVVGTIVGAGAWSLKTPPAAAYNVYQVISGLVSGKTYIVNVWVSADAGATTQVKLGVNDGTGANQSYTLSYVPISGTFQLLSIQYVANATGNIAVILQTSTGVGAVYWDSVTIGPLVLPPILTSGIYSGQGFKLYLDQDSHGLHMAPPFATVTGGFTTEVTNQGISGKANTRSTYQFTFHGTLWGLDSFRTGGVVA